MRLVVLGDPVDHSRSPLLHRTALMHTGLVGTYERRRVDDDGMKAAVDEMRRGVLDGANVTMPHKRLAHDLCDRVADDARRTGAVNTLVRVAEEVVGHNTDVPGVRSAWRWAGLPDDGPVTVFGAGGAAAAAVAALSDRPVTVCARRPEAAERLTELVGAGTAGEWGAVPQDAVVVNATPIGMHGEKWPDRWLDRVVGVFDMAYGDSPTPAVVAARAAGMPVADGADMLLAQAVVSFWLWTGRRAPLESMRAALEADFEASAT